MITVCMFECVCVCRQARAARGVRGGGGVARWRLQGQLRDWPLSGHPQHPSYSRLSVT